MPRILRTVKPSLSPSSSRPSRPTGSAEQRSAETGQEERHRKSLRSLVHSEPGVERMDGMDVETVGARRVGGVTVTGTDSMDGKSVGRVVVWTGWAEDVRTEGVRTDGGAGAGAAVSRAGWGGAAQSARRAPGAADEAAAPG